jgi:hypothetical protein
LFVREDSRDLVYAAWRTFWYMTRGWPREVGEQHQVWSRIGRDLLVVWPSRRVSASLTVISCRLPAVLQNEADAMELPDDAMPMVVDLAEVLTLLRLRVFGPAQTTMEALAGRMKDKGRDA